MPLAGVAALALLLSACSSNGAGDAGPSASQQGSGSSGATGGFKVNTADCTDPAAATKKVTGTWKIGYSAPLSGPVAGVVTYALDGYKARIAAQNAAGGINGVKIDVSFKDDAYTPDRAKANATEFLQQDHVDSLSTFGSGPMGAMADAQNAACVPLLYASASAQQYHDIGQYPWTLQYLPSSDTEARYDVNAILKKFPEGTNVGIAVNTKAPIYSEAFQAAAKGTKVNVAKVAPLTDPNSAATALKAANVDVVFIAGITNDCGPLAQALARVGFTPKMLLAPLNCADQTGWIQAGQAADGVTLPSYVKDPASPALADDAGVKEYLSQVTTPDKDNSITVNGWVMADLTINTLKQAAASPAGLTHASVIEAARNQSYASPMMMNGIKWVSTPTELTGFDKFQTMVWSASAKAFKPEGALIDVSGH